MILLATLATVLGLVPLAWLASRVSRGVRIAPGYWWIAGAFAVSFVADALGAFGLTPYASQVYPVSQAALIALVLLDRPAFVAYVALLLFAASLSIVWRGAGGYDVILRCIAWGGVALLAGLTLDRSALRSTLVLGFAAMFVAWLWFTLEPTFTSWGFLQLSRLATTAGFVVASTQAQQSGRGA